MEDLGTITDTAAEVLTTGDLRVEVVAKIRRIYRGRGLPWSDDRISQLKELRAKGWSCGAIAKEMGQITRCAIIGKLRRLGLSEPAKPRNEHPSVSLRASTSAGRKRRNRASEPGIDVRARFDRASPFYGNEPQVRSFPEATDIREEFIPPNPIRFIDAPFDGICKFPLGEPSAEMLICGEAATYRNYCTHHSRVAYRPGTAKL